MSELSRKRKKLRIESLDGRLCMAASVGWDGAGLGSAALTYYVGTTPASLGLDRATVKAALETALATWAKVADIVFTETSRAGAAHSIDFTFRSIDGRNGTLAQAYFPSDLNRGSIAGDVQFDTAESWEVGNGRGSAAVDFLWVAVHEIGHALGLDHAHGAGVVMTDSVSSSQKFTALAAADISAVLRLYGPSRSGVSQTDTGLSTSPTPPTTNADSTRNNTGPGPASPPSSHSPVPRFRYYYGWRRDGRYASPWRNSLNWPLDQSVSRDADAGMMWMVNWGWNGGARSHRSRIGWPGA
jgi:hypothetical protein